MSRAVAASGGTCRGLTAWRLSCDYQQSWLRLICVSGGIATGVTAAQLLPQHPLLRSCSSPRLGSSFPLSPMVQLLPVVSGADSTHVTWFGWVLKSAHSAVGVFFG